MTTDTHPDTQRSPWEIPIREPGPEPPAPEPSGVGRRVLALVVLVALALLATAAILGWLLDDGGDGAAEQTAPPTTTPITFAPRSDASSTTAPPETTTTAPPETTTTTTAPAITTTAPTTTAAPAPAATGSVPELGASFSGGWVAMLTSVPYSSGTSRLEAAYAEVRGAVPDAVATTGERWSSVADGYWVLLDAGPFGSEEAARSFCESIEGARTDCAPRLLQG